MRSIHSLTLLLLTALSGLASFGCQSGGVGDPCIPEKEYDVQFAGGTFDQVNVESKSFQCETRVCLSAYFSGRVSCPYGQKATSFDAMGTPDFSGTSPADRCYMPGYTPSGNADQSKLIQVEVPAQFVSRRPDKAVYCSCRCDGPDKNARYCQCPDGYTCQKNLIPDLGFPGGQLAGSYCVKKSAVVVDPKKIDNTPCDPAQLNCGKDKHPLYQE